MNVVDVVHQYETITVLFICCIIAGKMQNCRAKYCKSPLYSFLLMLKFFAFSVFGRSVRDLWYILNTVLNRVLQLKFWTIFNILLETRLTLSNETRTDFLLPCIFSCIFIWLSVIVTIENIIDVSAVIFLRRVSLPYHGDNGFLVYLTEHDILQAASILMSITSFQLQQLSEHGKLKVGLLSCIVQVQVRVYSKIKH